MKTVFKDIKQPTLVRDLGMIYPSETYKRKYRVGLYKCQCGNEFKARSDAVNSNNTLSCGCIKQNISKNKLYFVWQNMISRCYNKKDEYYKNYGGRGIKVCERWMDINNFIEDMYSSYKEGLTIDRINNDGNYEHFNCRWSTRSVQSRNTRILHSHNTSGYRGVSFDNNRNKWHSYISINRKRKFIGYFNTALEAAKAYDRYVIDNNLEHTINGV